MGGPQFFPSGIPIFLGIRRKFSDPCGRKVSGLKEINKNNKGGLSCAKLRSSRG
jgi:hypothetical protein